MLKVLRQDQEQAIEKLRESLRTGHSRPILQGPTGFGKTVVAAAIVNAASQRKKRMMFVVPKLSLIDQVVQSFYQEGIVDVGVIQANHEMTDWSQPIQVCSAQTLQRRTLPQADLVMIDECHLHFEFYSKWMLDPAWRKVPFIGLTATPWTRALGAYYDDLVVATTTQELIDAGHLSPFKVFAPTHPDLTGVRTVAGDYHEGELSTAMNKQPLVADIVQTWMQRAFGLPTFCFGVDRAHAKHIQQQFLAANVSCDYMDAYTSRLDREAIKRRFHAGEVRVVTNCDVLTAGIDWDVRCLIIARPTKSIIRHVQCVGRVLRTAEGKDHALILDHSDTHLRLGLVTDIQIDRLDDGKGNATTKDRKIVLPKECPKCAYLKPPRTAKCPSCGFVASPPPGKPNEDGELQEFKGKGKKQPTFEEKAEVYGALLYIANERGYQKGWAARRYKDRFGVWPRNMDHIRYMPPAQWLRSWVKSRDIAWAKSKRREDTHTGGAS